MKPRFFCTIKNVNTTATVTRQTEDGIYFKCDACGEEWSAEIGRYADLFQTEKVAEAAKEEPK